MVTSQLGQTIVRQVEMGLKEADLASLKRLLVVHINSARDWSQDTFSPEATHTETEGKRDTGTENYTQTNTCTLYVPAWLGDHHAGTVEALRTSVYTNKQNNQCHNILEVCYLLPGRLYSPSLSTFACPFLIIFIRVV